MDPDEARRDFQERLKQYESIYETLDEMLDKDIPYIKFYNVSEVMRRLDSISLRISVMVCWRARSSSIC